MKKFFLRIWKEQIAQDLTEYALLLLLIALAAITSMQTLSNGIKNAYRTTANDVTAGGNGGNNGNNNNNNNGFNNNNNNGFNNNNNNGFNNNNNNGFNNNGFNNGGRNNN